MHLLVESKLRLISHKHLPRNLYSQTPKATAVNAVKGRKVYVKSEGVAFHSVSYMAALIGEVNDAITFEQAPFSKIHESKTL